MSEGFWRETQKRERKVTEYETATLAIQQSTLAIQQAGLEISWASLEIQQAELEISRLGLWAQIVIPLVQHAIVAVGLWVMRKDIIAREKRHEEEKARHEKAMLALRASIEHTAPRPANDG